MTCLFCSSIRDSGDVVFEDHRTWVVLHSDWSPRGHAMVVSKRHVQNASELDEEEWLGFARVWHRVEGAILRLTGSERCVVLKLGIMTPHLHLHLYPARSNETRDVVFDAIEGRRASPRDDQFVEKLRDLLLTAPPC